MPRPPTVICYICHREYGTASIGIHEKTCLKKWHENNDKLPPSQRQPEPVRPQIFPSETSDFQKSTGTSGPSVDYEAYNAAAMKTSTLPCPRCGRHFETSKLPMHEAHCKPPPRPSRFHDYEARRPDVDLELLHTPLQGKSLQSTSSFRENNTGFVACRICGRTFAPDRIERHQENCKATPLKVPSKGTDSKTRQRTPPAQKLSTSCTKCGKSIPPGAKFCAQCGQPV
nr:zinc finger protein 474 [Hymenolepis microstoma]